jgi:hypothetical protein
VSYIPFEARLDRTAFEVILRETKPLHLLLINCSKRQCQKIETFLAAQNLPTRVHYEGNFQERTDSAVKVVYLDDNLYKTLPLQDVSKAYEVARVSATLQSLIRKSHLFMIQCQRTRG